MQIRMLVEQRGPTVCRVPGAILNVPKDVSRDEAKRMIANRIAIPVKQRRVSKRETAVL